MDNRAILDVCPGSEYFGRTDVIEDIYQHATSGARPPFGIYLVGKRWVGKTELLKRVYHGLFWDQDRVAPIYYLFKSYCSIEDFIYDYLKNFARQYLAFIKREPDIVKDAVSENKLKHLLADMGFIDISKLLSLYCKGGRDGDKMATLRDAMYTPIRTANNYGTPFFLILDDFNLAANIPVHEGRAGLLSEYIRVLMSGKVPYLATGCAKNISEAQMFPGSIRTIELTGLSEEASVALMEEMSQRYKVNYDSEVFAVAARQLEGNPAYMRSLMGAAAQKGMKNLTTIKNFIDLYVEELVEGNIGFSLGSVISIKNLNTLRLLKASIDSKTAITEEELFEDMLCDYEESRRSLASLCKLQLLEIDCGLIRWIGDNVMRDYINCLYDSRIKGRSRDEIKTRVALERLKEGYYMQGLKVKGRIKEELLGILKKFNGQMVPKILFHNQDFLARYSGKDIEEDDKISLPHMAGFFNDVKRGFTVIVGLGFRNGRYDDENEATWIIGVKENPALVHIGDVESFVRHCNALKSDFKTTTIIKWMIGSEGFAGEALKRLNIEGIYSTDMVQFRILRKLIEDKDAVLDLIGIKGLAPIKEFEIILPISSKAELVAARAVEEVGLDMGFSKDTTAQIKTALVEACINAFEHSKVSNSKVYCRFIVGKDKLIIQIQNEGRDFDLGIQSKTGPIINIAGRYKRGRGIELMKKLMDEVRFEKLRGGTKLVMVKHLKNKKEDRDEQRN
jgi:serine/threonine-protein kinase RsbW